MKPRWHTRLVHDSLYRRALLQGVCWTVLGVVVPTSLIASAAWLAFNAVFALILAIAFATTFITYICRSWGFFARFALPKSNPCEPSQQLLNVIDEIAIATGAPPPHVCSVDDDAPNIAYLPHGRDNGLFVVTTGLERILDRDELQAACAAQWSMSSDRWCGLFRRAVAAHSVLWILTFGVCVGTLYMPAGLIGLAGGMSMVAAERLNWWTQVMTDAVCIRATRYPNALVSALRKIALYNGAPVDMRRPPLAGLEAANTYWLVPVSTRADFITTVGRSGSRKIRISVEQEIDIQLITRAAMLQHSFDNAISYTSWKRLQRIISHARDIGVGGWPIELGQLEIWPTGAERMERKKRK